MCEGRASRITRTHTHTLQITKYPSRHTLIIRIRTFTLVGFTHTTCASCTRRRHRRRRHDDDSLNCQVVRARSSLISCAHVYYTPRLYTYAHTHHAHSAQVGAHYLIYVDTNLSPFCIQCFVLQLYFHNFEYHRPL